MATKKRSKKAAEPKAWNNKFEGVLVREKESGQLETWKAAAEKAGMKFSDWARAALDKVAGRKTS